MSELFAAPLASLMVVSRWASIGAPIANTGFSLPCCGLAIVFFIFLWYVVRIASRPPRAPAVGSETSSETRALLQVGKQIILYGSHVCTAVILIWSVLRWRAEIYGPPPIMLPDREAILQYELDKAKQELEDLKKLLNEQSKVRYPAVRFPCGGPGLAQWPGQESPSCSRTEGVANEQPA